MGDGRFGVDRLLIDVRSAAETLGIGRSKLYELLATGKLRKVKIGKRCLIPANALSELVRDLEAEQLLEEAS